MTLSTSVGTVLLAGGEIFVHAAPSAIASGLNLLHDGRIVPLHPIDKLPRLIGDRPFNEPFSYGRPTKCLSEARLDGTYLPQTTEAMVNGLQDWAVEHGSTLQLRVEEFRESRLIRVLSEIKVPASKERRTFRALIAAHRCDAELVVTFDSGTDGEVETVVFPFQRKFGGGRMAEGYQAVSAQCPIKGVDVTVSMQLRYIGYREDEQENYPYIFVANAEVVGPGASQSHVQPRQRTVGKAEAGLWHHGVVPLFRGADDPPLILRKGQEEMILFAADTTGVTLIDDYGHTLMVKADSSLPMMLFIDGAPTATVHLGTAETAIRLPASCLRGEMIDVSIRDLSGSQVFLSLPVLAPRALTPQDVMVRESRAPFPTDLTVRANHRYKALRAHLDHPVPGLDPASLACAARTLDFTFETLKLKPIAFPEVADPLVSVIIPAHNKVEVTYYSLCALLVAHNKTSFEVIVVDDASTDATVELETIVSGIRVIHNTEAQRFIRACNAGVAEARGQYVVLLNNDTEPTTGWLDALIESFARLDNVGLAGSKLLYPDGKLQDAGGIIWNTGNPWNYGNRANPWEPRFCYARQADYLSGAAMMTTRKIWDEVGGLSSYLEPMYFEDTDFAFKVRKAGYKTWFVPASIVYHFEGMTSGTDVSTGFKRFQEVNRPKFKRRWARDYAGFGKEGQSPDLEKDRGIVGRVLFIDYTTPREDRDAGSYAARREIELVQSLGYKVTFMPHNLAHLGSYTDALQHSGVEVITAPFYMSLEAFLKERAAEFDAVYITRYYVAQDTIRHIREHAPKARIILNNADLHFLRELRAAMSTDDPSRLAAMRAIRDQELEMMKAADLVLSYNDVEHAVIASHTDGRARVMTCPWVVDIPDVVPPLAARRGLSFLGSFNHHPNAEGVTWFCASVLPLLEGSGAHLTIYGAGMDDAIRALASDSVDPVGFVENIADAYDRHRIFVAPLLSGAGIKGKVLSAIAHGIPTVLTPVAAEGIGLRHGHDCLIAETPEDWARAITRLQKDDTLWASMSAAARSYAAERFSFAEGRAKIKAAFEAVDLFGAV
ncbi:glycosyltransferase [Roseicyclus mahoneyensis]|uniref:GT2 family glycosyltransferase n=1 Tax=Roseicyclus mahoneyensis TaxID=164332 RepID=A0A316GDP9_9RHOB|nr:glycosyltransferase [Roseicyclus mahoneyensis]PWK59101.1 GT2 family glycosyltransferase [Roseicyclus mahoneyensis]